MIGDDALGVEFRGEGAGMGMERGHSRRIEVHTSVRGGGGRLAPGCAQRLPAAPSTGAPPPGH